MTRLLIVELLTGLVALSTAWGFHSTWQASDRVFKPIGVVSEPEIIPASVASPALPRVEDEVVPDSVTPAPAAAQLEQPVIGPDARTAVTAMPPPSRDVADAGTMPVPDGARHHVRVALDDSLQDALAVAERLQSAGYPVSLSNAGARYQVALPTDFDTVTAEHLVQVLQHAGFRAELIP